MIGSPPRRPKIRGTDKANEGDLVWACSVNGYSLVCHQALRAMNKTLRLQQVREEVRMRTWTWFDGGWCCIPSATPVGSRAKTGWSSLSRAAFRTTRWDRNNWWLHLEDTFRAGIPETSFWRTQRRTLGHFVCFYDIADERHQHVPVRVSGRYSVRPPTPWCFSTCTLTCGGGRYCWCSDFCMRSICSGAGTLGRWVLIKEWYAGKKDDDGLDRRQPWLLS
jgi:hypothetical protein